MILSLIKKLYNNTNASAAVEMALIFPIFLVMLVGVLDYGSAFVRKMQLTEIAKVGVHYAMVKQPTYDEFLVADYAEIITRVNTNIGTTGNDTTTLTVTYICKCNGVDFVCTVDDACPAPSVTTTFIRVELTEDYETPFFDYSWLINNFPIAAEAIIRVNKV